MVVTGLCLIENFRKSHGAGVISKCVIKSKVSIFDFELHTVVIMTFSVDFEILPATS